MFVVEVAELFFDPVGDRDLSVRVAETEQRCEPLRGGIVEAFLADEQCAAGPVEPVVTRPR
jgi:hypothetical protein